MHLPEEKNGVSLKLVISGIFQALKEAKYLADMESGKLFEIYKKEKVLSSFTVPAFTISDFELELRFSIVDPSEKKMKEKEITDIKVNISPESLKELEAHHINVLKIKLLSENLRAFEESGS